MLTSLSQSESRYWGGDGGSMSLSLSESGCWCCGGGGGGDGDGGGGGGEREDGVCNCGEGADLSSEALFLVITVLSVCVQVVFTLGIGCTPSGSLPYLQRRCPLRKYMMGWHILGSYPNRPEAGREADWGSEFFPLKKSEVGSFTLLHKISWTACCFGICTLFKQYNCYESAIISYTDHQSAK